MAKATETIEELASRFFVENIAPGYIAGGVPEDGMSFYQARYVRDVAANPEAVRQLQEHYAH